MVEVRVATVETELRGDSWVGIIHRQSSGTTEWEISEPAARMIEMARREGYETAKAELRAWLAPKGGPR